MTARCYGYEVRAGDVILVTDEGVTVSAFVAEVETLPGRADWRVALCSPGGLTAFRAMDTLERVESRDERAEAVRQAARAAQMEAAA